MIRDLNVDNEDYYNDPWMNIIIESVTNNAALLNLGETDTS